MRYEILLPNPMRMLNLLSENSAHFFQNWWATLSVSLIASILALIIGLGFAILSLRFRSVEFMLLPVVSVSQSFPLQAIAPVFIIAMGIGFHTKTSIAFLIAFFPIYSSCLTALKQTPRSILAHLAICRASFWAGIYHCRISAALPAIASASKVGFTLSVLGAVVAEFIQPDRGLGSLILIAQSSYDLDVIYICVLFLIIQGTCIYGALSFLENSLTHRREN